MLGVADAGAPAAVLNLELQIQVQNHLQTYTGGTILLSECDHEQAGLCLRLVATYNLRSVVVTGIPSQGCLLRESTGIPEPAMLMSGLKQKCQGDCWLEMCHAGVLTAQLPSYP